MVTIVENFWLANTFLSKKFYQQSSHSSKVVCHLGQEMVIPVQNPIKVYLFNLIESQTCITHIVTVLVLQNGQVALIYFLIYKSTLFKRNKLSFIHSFIHSLYFVETQQSQMRQIGFSFDVVNGRNICLALESFQALYSK